MYDRHRLAPVTSIAGVVSLVLHAFPTISTLSSSLLLPTYATWLNVTSPIYAQSVSLMSSQPHSDPSGNKHPSYVFVLKATSHLLWVRHFLGTTRDLAC